MTPILRGAALAIVAAAVTSPRPAAAQAQPGDTIQWGTGQPPDRMIGLAECNAALNGAANGAATQLLATFTTTTDGTNVSQSVSPLYQVYSSNVIWSAGTGTQSMMQLCPIMPNATNGTIAGFVTSFSGASLSVSPSTGGKFNISAVLTSAGLNCSSPQATIYICAHWIPDSSTGAIHGSAWGRVTLQTASPDAPTGLSTPAPGDGSLTLSWSAPSTGATTPSYYQIKATSTDPKSTCPATGCFSPHVTGSTSGTIRGLVNNVTYTITVIAFSSAGNPSPESASVPGTPLPTTDFWTSYKNQGGKEQGGCGTGGGGLLALAGAALALLRRRS
jgi:hypothetical protein